jgi:hypothetical protein
MSSDEPWYAPTEGDLPSTKSRVGHGGKLEAIATSYQGDMAPDTLPLPMSPFRFSSLRCPPFLLMLVGVAAAGCGPKPPATAPGAVPSAQRPSAGTANILSFGLSDADSLRVDRIGLRDGALRPDGLLDLVFRAEVQGPIDALFVSTVTDKGDPTNTFRAYTLVGNQEPPEELRGVVERGSSALALGVEEGGRLINQESGALATLSPERHTLKLYVANAGTLREGMRLVLYATAPGGAVLRSQPFTY